MANHYRSLSVIFAKQYQPVLSFLDGLKSGGWGAHVVCKPGDEPLHEYTLEACVKVYNDGRAAGVKWLHHLCNLDGISVEALSPNDLAADMGWVAVARQRCRVCSPDIPERTDEVVKIDCQDKMHAIFSAGFACGVMALLVAEAMRR